MKRAQQWFTGVPVSAASRSDDDGLPVTLVQIDPAIRSALSRQSAALGRWRGGVLFGELHEGRLTVQAVAPGRPPGEAENPLHLDLAYLLGWSDSVAALLGEGVDWYDNWVATPDGRLPDERADLNWLAAGAQRGLFDEQHVLLVLGQYDGRLDARAYRWEEGAPVGIDCHLERLADQKGESPDHDSPQRSPSNLPDAH